MPLLSQWIKKGTGAPKVNDKAVGQLSGLAGRLVAEGLISAREAGEAQKEASLERMHFVQYLVEKKDVDSQRLGSRKGAEAGGERRGQGLGQHDLSSNGCDRNAHRSNFLNSKPGYHPLNTVGNIQHYFLGRGDPHVD